MFKTKKTIVPVSCIVLCIFINNVYAADEPTWPCIQRKISEGAIICVCNETYCDTTPRISLSPGGFYQRFVTTKSGLRFQKNVGQFADNVPGFAGNIYVDQSVHHQEIFGWGGTFTDSAGIDVTSLSYKAQDLLLRSLFAEEGISFSLCRVPMGGTDFSTRQYSYDDDVITDPNLDKFSLAIEDRKYKIPLITKAIYLSENTLKLIATPWSPPLWMKTTPQWSGQSFLKEQYFQTWANYYKKFLDEYASEAVPFWGITTGNEPTNGFYSFTPINSLGWSAALQGKWIAENLGPTIKDAYPAMKIIVHDDQRLYAPTLQAMLNNDAALKYIDGIAFHWYSDFFVPPDVLRTASTPKKDLFLIGTEAANGVLGMFGFEKFIDLGSWKRGANYAESIITDMWYNFTGWLDWNLAVNTYGGHSWTISAADAPIIINATAQEFYKQPMYYVFGHFSKFVPPGSVRIDTNIDFVANLVGIQAVSFLRPDKGIAVIVYNKGYGNQRVILNTLHRGKIDLDTEKESISTILFW